MTPVDVHGSNLAVSSWLSGLYVPKMIPSLEVIAVLEEARVRYVLVGAHGLGGEKFAHAAYLHVFERGGRRCTPCSKTEAENGWATLWSSSPTSQPQAAVRGARPGAVSLAEIRDALNPAILRSRVGGRDRMLPSRTRRVRATDRSHRASVDDCAEGLGRGAKRFPPRPPCARIVTGRRRT